MATILSAAHFVPEHVVSNDDLAKFMETSDQWIKTRSGIARRHWARDGNREFKGITNHEMAYRALQLAAERAGVGTSQIDAAFYATISPDNELPGSGVNLASSIKPKGIPVFEVRNQCSGFLYALMLARAYIDSGTYNLVAVIGSEIQSSGLSLTNEGRNTAVLFADGAGVVLLGPDLDAARPGILDLRMHADGRHADKLGIELPGFARPGGLRAADFSAAQMPTYPRMDGKYVFKAASLAMPAAVREVVESSGFALDDLALIVPHQANQRIIDMLEAELGMQGRVFSNIAEYGNTTAASIPIALSEVFAGSLLKSGDLYCLTSFGSGFSWGACLCRK